MLEPSVVGVAGRPAQVNRYAVPHGSVAERIRAERQTERFFRMRAAGTSGKKLLEILDKAPDREPDPGDEL